MNLDERDLWEPTTPANPAAVAKKCYRHDWVVPQFGVNPFDGTNHITPAEARTVAVCRRCNAVRDEARAKTGRNNRKRGGAAELVVARKLAGGEKVGPLGLSWDVAVPGFLRAQVKKLARWPSLAACIGWLDAIPAEPELRAVVVTGTGRGARSLIVMDLDEFADWFGQVKGAGK